MYQDDARDAQAAQSAAPDAARFARRLLAWYDAGHRALPWRDTDDPYAIWVSEIMLQQTRAETVVGYYHRFLCAFPTVRALAEASPQAVLKCWEGLGYYSRARNLQRAAQQVVQAHGGRMPDTAEGLRALPGIGDYTAGAVAAIAFGRRVAAVDGNVERVVSRACGIREEVTVPSVRRAIRAAAAALVPARRAGDYTNAIMELGACVCVPGTPDCARCPVAALCDAAAAGDADMLPVKQRARMPRTEARGVAVVTCQGRVLVRQRTEKLLGGLWEFPHALGAQDADALGGALAARGVRARWVRALGEARHVFTHIIWEMRLHLFEAEDGQPAPEGMRWVDEAGLEALPVPTALRAARREAMACLRGEPGKEA